jgi:hypothetical protein
VGGAKSDDGDKRFFNSVDRGQDKLSSRIGPHLARTNCIVHFHLSLSGFASGKPDLRIHMFYI